MKKVNDLIIAFSSIIRQLLIFEKVERKYKIMKLL